MSFEEKIKNWVTVDNQLKHLNEKTKKLRENRNEIATDIIEYADKNELNNATIKISDGRLRFANIKQTSPISLTFLKQCLDECIGDESTVGQIMDYIKEKRDVKYTPDIKRYYA